MRELSTIDRVRRIVEIATGDRYGDGDIVTNIVVGYAEPGYGPDEAVIVLGNWNDKRPSFGWQVRNFDGDRFPYTSTPPITKAHTIPSRLARILESAGAEIEWSDEWVSCGDCYRIFRSSADSYSWRMYGAYSEEDYVCADCLKSDPESMLVDYINEPTRCVTFLNGPELESMGFVKYNGIYENGWHPGQDDDPKAIFAEILEFNPNAEVVFILSEQSQFYIRFTAYVRNLEPSDEF